MPSFSRPPLSLLGDPVAAPFRVDPFAPPEWQDARAWDTTPAWTDDDTSPEAWRRKALCAQTDPEAFFPEKGGSTRDAKRVCTGCPVRAECLRFALVNDERFGIWGGLSERERRRVRLERREALSA
ncbi:MAG: Transcription factor WhiB [Frankiales bacterium]|nr:Transcription factor WhiB [Frankiales bacterium]